jgi:uncharacterized phage protein (TIGR02220 family)
MAWLRLWQDMPTDPKFRTVSKISKQPLSTVIAVYLFLMVDASCHATSRGVTLCHNEDIASALDLEISQVEDIKKAMQGKLLDGNKLTGWERRQPKKEDETASERQRRHRENKKNKSVTPRHAVSRSVTLDTDTDTDTEIKKEKQEKEKKSPTFLSGLPDDSSLFSDPKKQRLREKSEMKKQATEVIAFLNEQIGRSYEFSDTNLGFVMGRLKEGATVDQCRQVIARKKREWMGDEKMNTYLRPKTLFSKTNFQQYVGERRVSEDEY